MVQNITKAIREVSALMLTTVTIADTSYVSKRSQGANEVTGQGGTSATEQIKDIASAGSYTGVAG